MKRIAWLPVLLAAVVITTLSSVRPASAATAPGPTEPDSRSGLTTEPKVGEEVVDMRTETSKTFAGDEPGQFVTRVGAGPLHFKDSAGGWAEIDTGLAGPVRGRGGRPSRRRSPWTWRPTPPTRPSCGSKPQPA